MNRDEPYCSVEINPEDAKKLYVSEGYDVKIRSRRGEITACVQVTDRVPKGTVFLPFHYAEAAANMLTNTAMDPGAKIPELKVCAVALEAVL